MFLRKRLLSLFFLSSVTYAGELPLYISADKVTFDEKNDLLLANGCVEISEFLKDSGDIKAPFFKKKFKTLSPEKKQPSKKIKNERYLRADSLTYNRKTKELTLKGHIVFQDENDNVIHADSLIFDDQFNNGFIEHVKVLLTEDEGRITAQKATRQNGKVNIFKRAMYSPCKVCKDSPIPLWQLRAKTITHDQGEQEITYQNATMDIYGVPLLYAPYFFHPDPAVKRKSGFLFPTLGQSNNLGPAIKTPYFYVIDRHSDLTISPIITGKQGPILAAEYRKRIHRGDLKLAGSITESRKLNRNNLRSNQSEKTPPKTRFHLQAQGRFELSDYDLATIDINRASDTIYLRRYSIVTDSAIVARNKNLTSEAKVERFKGGTYAAIKGYAFQTDKPKTTPLVFPLAQFTHQTDPGKYSEILTFDTHLQNLSRPNQIPGIVPRNSQRAITQGRMYLPYIHRSGQMIEWESLLRGDLYNIDGFTRPEATRKSQYAAGRLFPQTAVTWRIPLINRGSASAWMLEPLMQLNLAPSGLNPQKIPNEDSRLSELDDTNLFFLSRMNGFDRTDTGQRFVYGLNNGFYGPQRTRLFWFIGQSQRLNKRKGSIIGDQQHTSDYVTKIQVYPSEYFKIHYRGRFSKRGDNQLSEVTTNLGKPLFCLSSTYIFVTKNDTPIQKDIRQVNWSLSSHFLENWKVSFSQNQNLVRSQKNSSANMASLMYENDCFQTSFGIFQTRYRDRDLHPDKGFLIQFSFKNLGTFKPTSSGNFPNMTTRTL